jgi:hypothetical protein
MRDIYLGERERGEGRVWDGKGGKRRAWESVGEE